MPRYRHQDDINKKSLESISMRYGLTCGVLLIFVFIIMYYVDFLLGDEIQIRYFIRPFIDLGYIKYVNIPIIFYIIYRAAKIYKIRHNYTQLSYVESIWIGIIVSVIAIAIIAAFSILFYKIIDPANLNYILTDKYFNEPASRVARAFQFMRPYIITLVVSAIYTVAISFHLIREERSH